MNESLRSSFSHLLGLALVLPLSACGSSDSGNGDGNNGGGGSGGTTSGGDVMLVPSADGWIDAMDAGNTIGVQGAWYPYGDAYGEAKCINVGMHTADQCSVITTPDPNTSGFPNTGGMMCTAGTIAQVIAGPDGMPDYSNIWGAGIGLDLNSITGISFKLDQKPLTGLRVEFPMPATEGAADGSDYWGAGQTGTYPPSPVAVGVNVVKWDQVQGPRATSTPFDPTQMLAIQFHAPAATSSSGTYAFCISELTFLTQ
jgi:hypothetical protein